MNHLFLLFTHTLVMTFLHIWQNKGMNGLAYRLSNKYKADELLYKRSKGIQNVEEREQSPRFLSFLLIINILELTKYLSLTNISFSCYSCNN